LLNGDNDLIMIGYVVLLGDGQTRAGRLVFVFSRFRNGVVCWENILDPRQIA